MNKIQSLCFFCAVGVLILMLPNCKKNYHQGENANIAVDLSAVKPVINFTFTKSQNARSISLEAAITNNARISDARNSSTNSMRSVGCAGTLDGSWSTNGYHQYATDTIRLDTMATSTVVNVYVNAYDVPNRFTVINLSTGTTAASSPWMGYASYSGPWGMSLNTSPTGTLSFTRGSYSLYGMVVETILNGSSDYYYVSIGCTY
jgi:hypothetical protein